jgi:hypothetical protein
MATDDLGNMLVKKGISVVRHKPPSARVFPRIDMSPDGCRQEN